MIFTSSPEVHIILRLPCTGSVYGSHGRVLLAATPFSQFVKTRALEEGVDSTFFNDLDQPSHRITAAFSFNNDRAFLSYADLLPDYAYGDMIEKTQPAWIYITHLVLGEQLHALTAAGRAAGAKIFMDCQAHQHALEETVVQRALQSVDVFSPNRGEAEQMTGEKNVERMLEKLAAFSPAVIIKDGANGCHYRDKDQILHTPVAEIDVVDTTGAGDNFDSGFLYGMLRGYGIIDCLRMGNLCGAQSVRGFGGTSTSPTESELLELIKKSP